MGKEGKGCYQTASKCTVMWQGMGGAAGWSGSSSQPVSTKCECRQCGSAVAFPYGGGNCGVASATCSATVGGAGCYSSASSGCDCKSYHGVDLITVRIPVYLLCFAITNIEYVSVQ